MTTTTSSMGHSKINSSPVTEKPPDTVEPQPLPAVAASMLTLAPQ